MSEPKPEYITDAEEMLGTGYEPAATIEPPRKVFERRAGKMHEVDKPAFVKLSTAFKDELPGISGDALKVWIFISLSINRNTGKANPGLRTISKGVGLAVNTVQKCLKELEEAGLLIVDRETLYYNQYEAPEYVSANKAEPTVSNGDTPSGTVSNSEGTVSKNGATVSPSVILNQKNQSKPDLVDLELRKLARQLPENEALKAFERDMQCPGSWTWYPAKTSDEPAWKALREFVVSLYQSDPQAFGKYYTWSKQPFSRGAMTLLGIKRNPQDFELSWKAFCASDMFVKKTDEERPEYKPFKPQEGNYVPRPEHLKPNLRKSTE